MCSSRTTSDAHPSPTRHAAAGLAGDADAPAKSFVEQLADLEAENGEAAAGSPAADDAEAGGAMTDAMLNARKRQQNA